jgi:hypothetical protein
LAGVSDLCRLEGREGKIKMLTWGTKNGSCPHYSPGALGISSATKDEAKTVKTSTTKPISKDAIEKDLFALYILTPFKSKMCMINFNPQ